MKSSAEQKDLRDNVIREEKGEIDTMVSNTVDSNLLDFTTFSSVSYLPIIFSDCAKGWQLGNFLRRAT